MKAKEQQMVADAMKIAELRSKNTGKKQTDYDTLQALTAMYPDTKTWSGHKLMNIIRAINRKELQT